MDRPKKIRVTTFGAFGMFGSDGVDITPPGKRAKAIVAMLIFSPNGVRNRRWLQDKLWSERTFEQGAASLRQEISTLKKHFHKVGFDLLNANRETVSLKLNSLLLDTKKSFFPNGKFEFLEGLDINDLEFEDWLRDERRRFEVEESLPQDITAKYLPDTENHATAGGTNVQLKQSIPRIVIREFQAIGNSSREKVFAAGVTEELLTVFGKLNGAFHVTRITPDSPSSNDFEITGAVRSGDLLRVTARLTILSTGKCIWSGRFNYGRSTNFDAQEEIARQVIENAQLELTDGSWAQNWTNRPTSLDAWEEYQLGRIAESKFRRESTMKAIQHYRASIRFDSNFLPAHISLGFCYLDQFRLGWAPSPDKVLKSVKEIIQSAFEKEPDNHFLLALDAFLENALGRHTRAKEMMKSALELSPRNPEIIAYDGVLKSYHGDLLASIGQLKYALSLTQYPPAWIQTNLALHQILLGDPAVSKLISKILSEYPSSVRAHVFKIVYLIRENQIPEAKTWAKRLRSLEPGFVANKWSAPECFSNPEHFLGIVDDLKKAGL